MLVNYVGRNEGKIVGMTPTIVTSVKVCVNDHQRDLRLARLAMLIECEGSITIGMTPPTKTRNRPALYPTLDLTNTSMLIIDEARDTLVQEGIGFTFRPNTPSRGIGKKFRHDINIHGRDRIEGVIVALLPWLRSKKPQAELLLEFIKSRRASHPKAMYSDRKWQITFEVRKLNTYSPSKKAIAKAKAYLQSVDGTRTRTIEYFQRYIKMCAELQAELDRPGKYEQEMAWPS